jgi:hypothetical protein
MKTTSPIKANMIRPTVAMIGQTFRDGSVIRLSSFTELEEESLSCVIGDMETFYVTAAFRQTFSSCRVVGISEKCWNEVRAYNPPKARCRLKQAFPWVGPTSGRANEKGEAN